MSTPWIALLGCALLCPSTSGATEGGQPPLNPQDVAVLAATCSTCHGPGGIPSLRGLRSDFLLQRLRAFKAMGHEKSDANATIMPLLMQGYDDAQIRALAQWFSLQERP